MAQALPSRSSESTVQKERNYFNRGVPWVHSQKKRTLLCFKPSEGMQEPSKLYTHEEDTPDQQMIIITCFAQPVV